jgi:SAM-dependent methyltransferase
MWADAWQLGLAALVVLLAAHYALRVWLTRAARSRSLDAELAGAEGFADGGGGGGSGHLDNDSLFDGFYARVYDHLVGGDSRVVAEVKLLLAWAKTFRPDPATLKVLDVGSGTGGAVAAFHKEGVAAAVGIDPSAAMVAKAKKAHPGLDFRVGAAETTRQFAPGAFSLATLLYHTVYYLKDRREAWRNLFEWLEPGGLLVVHVVNKTKFDPVLEAASPFVAFSVQRHAKERVTKSHVTFKEFEYFADFAQPHADRGEFRETFAFKDGRKRTQTHYLDMPDMKVLTAEAEAAGFVFKRAIDMTPVGYEYNYLFCFTR